MIKRAETWRQVADIRACCDAVEERHPLAEHAATKEWIGWARAYLDRVDPLRSPPEMPEPPEEVRLEDLKPFLDGWSPYGPDRWR